MEKLKLYVVTKPSSDGSFEIGNIVYLSESNDLVNATAGGWLSENEWNVEGTNDFEYEECKTHSLSIVRGAECVNKIEEMPC